MDEQEIVLGQKPAAAQNGPKLNLMVLNRNYVLVSKTGHAIQFRKDQPVHVPPAVYPEAVAVGALRADGKPVDVIDDRDVKKPPSDVETRTVVIEKAFEVILKKNEREDFAASGMPTAAAVTREAGFRVDSKEIRGMWVAYNDKKALARLESE